MQASTGLEVKSFSATSGDDSLEELLLPNSTMAIEHDLTSLYRPLKEGNPQPGPMPLGIAVVDASIIVFGMLLIGYLEIITEIFIGINIMMVILCVN